MRWIAPLLAVLSLAGCGGGGAGTPSGPARQIPIGLAADVEGTPNVAGEVEAVRLTGAHWLREDLEWSFAQTRRGGAFDWSRFDAVVGASAQRRIHVLPILGSSPCWAVKPGTPPDDCSVTLPRDADFARFARAAVARYGPRGSFWDAHPSLDRGYAISVWEVWNEPYLPSGALPVSAARYSSLFAAAADAGRAQAPRSEWLFPASAIGTREDGSTFGWLGAVADAAPEIAAKIDALAIHVYPHAQDGHQLNATRGSAAVVATFAKEFGVARPAWITELGFAACDPDTGANPCVPGADRAERERNKARLMGQAIDQFRRTTFADAVFIYTLREYDSVFQGDVGLIGIDGRPLPAYRVFRRAAR